MPRPINRVAASDAVGAEQANWQHVHKVRQVIRDSMARERPTG
ncbi:MAG: hypothetical protein QHC40_06840 [Sphingobium sp.]|nr:hypothetical protein [Sphingobium sp.]